LIKALRQMREINQRLTSRRRGKRIYVETRQLRVGCPADQAFAVIRQIDGNHGWYAFDGLWMTPAWVDALIGRIGVRRGRGHSDRVEPGDLRDWQRVEAFESGRRILLQSETRIRGRAWLDLSVVDRPLGSVVKQRLTFEPHGWIGRLYWLALTPLHDRVFRRLVEGIAMTAHALWDGGSEPRVHLRRRGNECVEI